MSDIHSIKFNDFTLQVTEDTETLMVSYFQNKDELVELEFKVDGFVEKFVNGKFDFENRDVLVFQKDKIPLIAKFSNKEYEHCYRLIITGYDGGYFPVLRLMCPGGFVFDFPVVKE